MIEVWIDYGKKSVVIKELRTLSKLHKVNTMQMCI